MPIPLGQNPPPLGDEESEYERMLREQLSAQPMQQEAPMDVGQLGASLAKSASQMGSIGGRMADTSGLQNMADVLTRTREGRERNLLAQNEKRQDILAKLAQLKDTKAQKESALAQGAAEKESERAFKSGQSQKEFENQKALLALRQQQKETGEKPAAGKPPTEAQANNAYHATRAIDANNLLSQIESQGYNPASYSAAVHKTNIPFVGQYFANEEDRAYDQAARSFIASVLRKETGASVTPTEFETYGKIYLPQPGDSPAILKQKAAERERASEMLAQGAGPAYDPSMQKPFQYQKSSSGKPTAGEAIATQQPNVPAGPPVGQKPVEEMTDEEVAEELARLKGNK